MPTMLINAPTVAAHGPSTDRFSALIQAPNAEPESFFFDLPTGTSVALTAEPFITALLPICMLNGFDLSSKAPVRPGFLQATNRVQDILHCWYPQLLRITISAPERQPDVTGTGACVFFSGGVDSFYSVKKHYSRISEFVVIQGFDIAHWNGQMWPQVEASLRTAAAELRKPLLPVNTNVRAMADSKAVKWKSKFFDEFWLRVLHGAALAAVGYVLASRFSSVIIPSTHTYANLAPFGSHPLLDESWSTPTLRIEHDGSEATRFDKIGAIKDFQVALNYLRVCWRNWDDKYNCGRCEKCLRTILILKMHGALNAAKTLPPFNPGLFDITEIPPHLHYYYEDLLSKAHEIGDSAAVRACEMMLGKRIRWSLLLLKAKRRGAKARQKLNEVIKGKQTNPLSGLQSKHP